ncbi:hypothetical protein GOP47_0020564 [Adiantum capillus-veneris]|uniref:DUF4371 domain-containing protein n=1 Tax=Adiantum capillus-veneris TaxID=13818 RepID=A0A9D4Z735_ADICA|nr:hypothetical protein GOP47_0020564 [Adiantum capillus-veneris]
MPIAREYSAYMSTSVGKEFANAIKQVYWERLKRETVASPFYSLQIDESTNVTTQQYMVIYVTYMRENDNGSICTSFVDLLHVKNVESQSLYTNLMEFLVKMKLALHKMIGIATDGASVMIGANNGVVLRLKKDVLHLLGFHCVAQRESLATRNAFKLYKEFKFVDKVTKKLYEWVSKSTKQHLSFAEVVKDFNLGRSRKLKLLKIHNFCGSQEGKL